MMRFSVASWHKHHDDPQWWLSHNGYTTMTLPPQWAQDANRNLALFAPPSHIVFGNYAEEAYTPVYWNTLRDRWGAIRAWVKAHEHEHVILLCACPDGKFCHRLLIAKLLRQMGCEEVPFDTSESAPMEDVVVTVPLTFGLENWIDEGDAVGESESGEEWHFYLPYGPKPIVNPGARVYVTYNGILRGYAPLVRVEWVPERSCWALVRHGGAVAVTIDTPIPGFRGVKACWWDRAQETPFDYPWYDGSPAWTVPMEWQREPLEAKKLAPTATHAMGLMLDGIPIAAYYKVGKTWECSKCAEVFPNANAVQEHIKASQHHIKHGVERYSTWVTAQESKVG